MEALLSRFRNLTVLLIVIVAQLLCLAYQVKTERDELAKPGIYILSGTDPLSGAPSTYIGEAEVIRERLKQHKAKEWVSAIVFVSKDENLTKAHVRYLEGRLLAEAAQVGRFTLEQNQPGGSKLPEADRADMEAFLSYIRQLLPVLGSDLLIPVAQSAAKPQAGGLLFCRRRGAEGRGYRVWEPMRHALTQMMRAPERGGVITTIIWPHERENIKKPKART